VLLWAAVKSILVARLVRLVKVNQLWHDVAAHVVWNVGMGWKRRDGVSDFILEKAKASREWGVGGRWWWWWWAKDDQGSGRCMSSGEGC
jgi:hypothetical protein